MLITRGRALAQRIYDIADEIDMAEAERLVRSLSRRPDRVRSAASIRLQSPPLEMPLGTRPCPLPGIQFCEVYARIYDVGALAVTFSIELPTPLDGEALIAFADRMMGREDYFTGPGRTIANEISAAIKPACAVKNVSQVTEDYTIFLVSETEPKVDADSLTDHLDVARLLLGETGPISQRERRQQSHAEISYSPNELVLLDWNSAFVYDTTNASDLADLLELTSMQLLELRAYDDIVGRSLARYYDDLGVQRFFESSKWGRLSREIMRTFVEVTEMSDRIENSLTTLGDSWLARVHRAAIAEFDVPRWQRLLKDKLEVLRQINELLADQITASKTLNVEIAIVVLIVLEIVLALFEVV